MGSATSREILRGRCAGRTWRSLKRPKEWIDLFDGFWMEPVEPIDASGDTAVAVELYGGCAKQKQRPRSYDQNSSQT